MGFLADYLSENIIQWLRDKAKENPLYQKLTGNIIIISSHNSELNQLLEESIKVAKANKIIAVLDDDDILTSIDKNIDIISECIVLPKDHLPLSNFLIRIKYTDDNGEHHKQIETFYKSLYEQLYDNKQNFPTLQNIQIQTEIGKMRDDMKVGFSNNDAKLEQILSIIGITDYAKLSYNDELNTIENKIKSRDFAMAREMALNLEEKINKTNKQEEIEKLYALIINTYLLEGEKQENALDYFDNLIAHTSDKRKKKARNILRLIIRKEFKNAQTELDIVFHTGSDEKIDAIFYENQINLYFMSGNFTDGYNFVIKNKNIINNYQYYLALMLVQQRKFDDAKKLLEENKDFFYNTDFEIKEMNVLIRSHFLLQEMKKTTTIDIINELKELSFEIKILIVNTGDCKIKKSYLHSVNAIIMAAIFGKEAARNEYEKALELDPNNFNALGNYPYLLLDNNKNMEKALGLIQKCLEKYPDSLDDKILYYSVLTELNPNKVIEEISLQKNIEIELKIYFVYALDKINQHTKAEFHLKEMLEENINNFSAHFCAGWHYVYVNEPNFAIESFMKAHSLCRNENDYHSVFYYLLMIVCSEHYIDKMIIVRNWLEIRYSTTLILFKYPQHYIHILLVLNDYEACIACCNELRGNGISDDYIANAEFTCYYNTKNFQKVKQVLNENRIKYSDEILIRMAYSCAHIGEYNLTKEILRKIRKPESRDEFIIFASLYFSIKEYQESLKTIHDAYQKYPNERNIQEIFIKLVYGHHIQTQTEDIANSFGNCLQEYREAKFDNKIIQEISIPENANGEDILKIIASQFPDNSDIDRQIEIIRINRLPISFYKTIFKKSIFSIHNMVANSTNIQIWCTEKFENDLNHIRISSLYIDLSSLITLELLDLLDIVRRLFPSIYITQSVLDEILYFDNELSEPFCDHVIINYGKQDDFFSKNPREEIITAMRNRVGKLKSFVLSGGNIQVIGTVLSPKREISKHINDFLLDFRKMDISESDTMRFSYSTDCQAMIESVALRVAFNSFDNSPLGFGIDSLLKYLLEKSLISKKVYFLSLTSLIENSYRRIPISVEHMLFVIQYEGYIILQKHNKFFNILASQEYNFENMANKLALLLCHIWNDIVPSEGKKGEWSDYLLGIISLNPLMNDEWKYQIINYIGTHTKTKQNYNSFLKYIKRRMITPEVIKN
jgi:tetratricopeptide (TPR) repeat protein